MEWNASVLRRLAYSSRFGAMEPRFGSPVPVISMAANHVIDFTVEPRYFEVPSSK